MLAIVTPLRWQAWEGELAAAGCLEEFADVPMGIRDGFRLGVQSSVKVTHTPPNHKSATDHPEVVEAHIRKERSAGRYTGPFHPDRLELIIGPFRSAPLGTVPKGDSFRIIGDMSFEQDGVPSVNSEINAAQFPCEWGTFADCAVLVAEAVPGTQAAIFDVAAAYRCIPISPLDQPHAVIMWKGLAYLDHNAAFGCTSSNGLFGRPADAIRRLFIVRHSVEGLLKWVDDFVFFRYPINNSTEGPWEYTYSEGMICKVAEHLGWPWAPEKHQPFGFSFTYIGFEWRLADHTVAIPSSKKAKYMARLEQWERGHLVSRKVCDAVIGTLNHCCLAVPEGRSRMPSLYRFAASFVHMRSRFSTRQINADVANDIAWWRNQLSKPFCGSRLSIPPPTGNDEIFVDASTSWGIGIIINGSWFAWKLKPGWKTDGRDIGWAEMVAAELVMRTLIATGRHDCSLRIRSDNSGVVGALHGGCSRNAQQNQCLQRIVSLFTERAIWPMLEWVSTKDNIADAPSRGILPPASERLPCPFAVPPRLRNFIESIVPFTQ